MTDQTAFDTATRIAAGDDGTSYDPVAMSLHWATALLVVANFALAKTWDWFAKPTAETMQGLHISFGVLLTAVIVTRVIWRLIPSHQISLLEVGWQRLASKATHYLLYALLVAQAVSGFVWRWAQGHPVGFFGLFAIPGPFDAWDRASRRPLHTIHEWIGWAIVIIALLHALAALYHHYVLKDRVLVRMLPARAGARA
jgi:cytochrome b561